MTEKVLGFKEKDIEKLLAECLCENASNILEWDRRTSLIEREKDCLTYAKYFLETNKKEGQVHVVLKSDYETTLRLYSESVAREALLNKKWVEWLEKWCEINRIPRFSKVSGKVIYVKSLLSAVRKEAKK